MPVDLSGKPCRFQVCDHANGYCLLDSELGASASEVAIIALEEAKRMKQFFADKKTDQVTPAGFMLCFAGLVIMVVEKMAREVAARDAGTRGEADFIYEELWKTFMGKVLDFVPDIVHMLPPEPEPELVHDAAVERLINTPASKLPQA